MKRIGILISVIGLVAFAISCSQQVEPTAQFTKSSATFAIASTVTTVTAASKDSLTSVFPITWNDPKYAVGLSQSMFTAQIAKTGTNFTKFESRSFTGVLTGSLLAKDLNKIALQLGGAIGQPISLDIKVVASLVNNNEQLTSNVVQVSVVPYSDLQLVASSTTVVTTADNASQVGLTLSWNAGFAGYEGTRTYEFQYAKGGTNFATPIVTSETTLGQSYKQVDLNNIAALDYGVLAGSTGTVDFRVKVTNGLGAVIYSNTITVTITPYSSKPVPKYTVPANLYITGDATPGGWQVGDGTLAGGVPLPSQQFTQIDDNTFGMIIQLTAGGSYLLLPVNSDWSHKFNPPNSGENAMGDVFAPDAGNNNIPAPATSGLYQIIVDFVKGTYSLTAVTTNPIPTNLYITGDATAGGWQVGDGTLAGGVPLPSQQFTQVSNGEFQLSIPLNSSGQYLLLPVNSSWTDKFNPPNSGENPLGDVFAKDAGNNNFPAPTTGTYLIDVNFFTMKYKLTQ